MSKNMQNYNKTIRNVVGKVDMNFYENTADNDADVITNFDLTDWRKYAQKQLISAGLTPKYKYASVEGLTYLDGTYYVYPNQADTIIPLWSTQLADANKLFNNSNLPTYILNFYNKRRVNSLRIIGDEQRNEYPVSYVIRVYTNYQDEIEEKANADTPNGYAVKAFTTIPAPVISADGSLVYEFAIDMGDSTDAVRQFIDFGYTYQAHKIEMIISKWSKANTTAKLMFFSNETRATFENDQLASIKVLEEKTSNIEELSYGLTSNTCEVKVSNANNRFTKNPDLLKKNRIVKPYIKCREDEEWDNLGTFYSDSWGVSSTSKYVTCKCYDVLYNLQKIYLYYEMEGGTTIGQNYTVEQNKSYYDVFTKVGQLINKARAESGIYGADINFVIDERLKQHYMSYVLLGYDTAWNMLKELANQALSFVYVDRAGNICVVRDELGEDRISSEDKVKCQTQINEDNAFSYNLPTMSRTVVNRVIVPYLTLEAGDETSNEFEIKEEDITYDEDGCKKVVLELKNFYPSIMEIERLNSESNKISLNAKSIKVCYNRVEIIFNETNSIGGSIYIKIMSNSNYKLVSQTLQIDNYVSQKRNGIVEYELDSTNIFEKIQAEEVANAILAEYANGKSYIETEWFGNPEADLGSFIDSRSKKEEELTQYEIVSNELTLENGLRFSSKARQN